MAAELVITAANLWGVGKGDIGVRDGRIVPAEVGPDTEVIDGRGKTVVPGFQDAHVHTPFAGLNRLRVWLNDADTREDYLRIIADHAAGNKDGWITGGGWSMPQFPGGTPRKEDLDAIVPDRPVFLFNRDVHGAWLNSKALELAGITAGTPDPPHGRVERDSLTGEPTGTLHEGAAYWVNEHVVPTPTRGQWEAAILEGQRHLHS
ncbi:MAG: amidohydrolase family protein, partial [Candidatus Nanopelagicales bacterium]|nr:amidohydrolase family protein [Candidatus Nanopelagicales bacterium]